MARGRPLRRDAHPQGGRECLDDRLVARRQPLPSARAPRCARRARSALLSLLAGAGCAGPVAYVTPAAEMTVHNEGGAAIRAIVWKGCGAPDASYAELPGSAIAPGASVALPLIDGCADLQALRSDGEVAGRQLGLHMLAGSQWRIR